jgi:membrane protease YdiL (CAAX protease family)
MMETANEARHWPTHLATLVPVLVLWLGYSTLQTLGTMEHLSIELNAFLGFLPGLLGLAMLRAAGFSLEDCYLRVKPLSRPSLAVLVGVYVFALAAVLPFGVWRGWDWVAALVYAPAGGISQELFFRAVLLPVLLSISKREIKWNSYNCRRSKSQPESIEGDSCGPHRQRTARNRPSTRSG